MNHLRYLESKPYSVEQDLAEFLLRNPPPPAQIRRLSKSLARALAYLDTLNINTDEMDIATVDQGAHEVPGLEAVAHELLQFAYPLVDVAMNFRERVACTVNGKLRPPHVPLPTPQYRLERNEKNTELLSVFRQQEREINKALIEEVAANA